MLLYLAQGAPTQFGPIWYVAITVLLAALGGMGWLFRQERARGDRLEAENQRLQKEHRDYLEAAVAKLEAAQQARALEQLEEFHRRADRRSR